MSIQGVRGVIDASIHEPLRPGKTGRRVENSRRALTPLPADIEEHCLQNHDGFYRSFLKVGEILESVPMYELQESAALEVLGSGPPSEPRCEPSRRRS